MGRKKRQCQFFALPLVVQSQHYQLPVGGDEDSSIGHDRDKIRVRSIRYPCAGSSNKELLHGGSSLIGRESVEGNCSLRSSRSRNGPNNRIGGTIGRNAGEKAIAAGGKGDGTGNFDQGRRRGG